MDYFTALFVGPSLSCAEGPPRVPWTNRLAVIFHTHRKGERQREREGERERKREPLLFLQPAFHSKPGAAE